MTDIFRAALARAIDTDRAVHIVYTDVHGDITERTVEPYAIETTFLGDTIVRTMDRRSGHPRSFRLDRLQQVTPLDEPFILGSPFARSHVAPVTSIGRELDEIDAALARIRAEIAEVAVYDHWGDAAHWSPEN